MKDARIRKMKFVALLITVSLIGVTSAAIISMRLPWNLTTTDAAYTIRVAYMRRTG